MKTSIVMSAIVVGALTVAGSAAARQEGAQKEHSMTGCLQKGATPDTYVVQNTAEKGPKMIGIVASKANLAPHVGHKIEITGATRDHRPTDDAAPASSVDQQGP
jgi:hypothetical protein